MIIVDRDEVPESLQILSECPVTPVEEVIRWTTNIYIAGDGSEDRTSVMPFPSITLSYNFLLNCSKREFLDFINDKFTARFLIPLYHQGMLASTVDTAGHGRVELAKKVFPIANYVAWRTEKATIYKKLAADNVSHEFLITDNQRKLLDSAELVYVMPCAIAYIGSRMQITDQGRYRDGLAVFIQFDLTHEYEVDLFYEEDTFDFPPRAQAPEGIRIDRNQIDMRPQVGGDYSFVPNFMDGRVGKVSQVEYLLRMGTDRDDHPFRGVFFKNKGAQEKFKYIYEDQYHRLLDDRLRIRYYKLHALGRANFKYLEDA